MTCNYCWHQAETAPPCPYCRPGTPEWIKRHGIAPEYWRLMDAHAARIADLQAKLDAATAALQWQPIDQPYWHGYFGWRTAGARAGVMLELSGTILTVRDEDADTVIQVDLSGGDHDRWGPVRLCQAKTEEKPAMPATDISLDDPNDPIPCPFCGGHVAYRMQEGFTRRWFYVACGCEVAPRTQLYETAAQAIAVWNRRASDANLVKLRRERDAFQEERDHMARVWGEFADAYRIHEAARVAGVPVDDLPEEILDGLD